MDVRGTIQVISKRQGESKSGDATYYADFAFMGGKVGVRLSGDQYMSLAEGAQYAFEGILCEGYQGALTVSPTSLILKGVSTKTKSAA